MIGKVLGQRNYVREEEDTDMNNLKRIVVTQSDSRYIADRPDLPGSPVIGYGKSWKEAIGDLLWHDQLGLGIEIEVIKKDTKK